MPMTKEGDRFVLDAFAKFFEIVMVPTVSGEVPVKFSFQITAARVTADNQAAAKEIVSVALAKLLASKEQS